MKVTYDWSMRELRFEAEGDCEYIFGEKDKGAMRVVDLVQFAAEVMRAVVGIEKWDSHYDATIEAKSGVTQKSEGGSGD